MTPAIRAVSLAEARREVAAMVLDALPNGDESVGDVALWPHQRDAVSRLGASIGEFGGALLADDVGTGKTFVALALASRYRAPLVVAPAALRGSWRLAAERAGCTIQFISVESLSRRRRPRSDHDFVIVDEAHHARNPSTRRYATLATLVAGTPTVLLTATPIHNRRDDLIALLALFLGATAAALDDAALARCVIRRGRGILQSAAAIPAVHGPIPLAVGSLDDETPAAILALPPPVPAADAGTADALVAMTLLRQWASSQGALLAAIRRRLAGAHALASTLDLGRYPTRGELAGWTLGDDAQQLAMVELLAPGQPLAPARELRAAVAAHIDGLRALRRIAATDPELDGRRARRLDEACRAHPGARAIAFTQFAGSVGAYWRALPDRSRVCALTADGGRVAGGPVSRAVALGSFAPGRRRAPDPAHRIDTLLVTDLASEGLDLHDASVLVHLDLPWTPARLEQRVGRIVRPGSPHALVHVYSIEPPLRAAVLLDIRRRLEQKLAAARSAFGDVMPALGLGFANAAGRPASRPTLAPPAAAERIERILRRWSDGSAGGTPGIAPRDQLTVASARSQRCGWLAVLDTAPPTLVAAIDDHVSDAPSLVGEACALVDSGESGAAPDLSPVGAALAQLESWLDTRRAAALAGVPEIPVVRGRRAALSTVARLATSPASARAVMAPAAARALALASRPLPVAVERDLRLAHPADDLLAAFPRGARDLLDPIARSVPRIRALILLIGTP